MQTSAMMAVCGRPVTSPPVASPAPNGQPIDPGSGGGAVGFSGPLLRVLSPRDESITVGFRRFAQQTSYTAHLAAVRKAMWSRTGAEVARQGD